MVSQVDFLYDIYLDLNGMEISRVTLIDETELTYRVTQVNPNIGDALHIFLINPLNKGKSIDIVVYYQTNEKQTATSWNPKENTPSKNMPLMYTQCETINC